MDILSKYNFQFERFAYMFNCLPEIGIPFDWIPPGLHSLFRTKTIVNAKML